MPAIEYVAALDVGTTKICTIIAEPAADGTMDILGVGLSPSAGIRRGVVADLQEAIAAIADSVDEAERMANLPVAGAYVGITGGHIAARNVTGRVHVNPTGEVTADDVQKAVQNACDSVPVEADQEIVHRIVREFAIDGQEGIRRPIGMSGRRLDAKVHIVTGTASVRENLERCVGELGIKVQKFVLEPLATSLAVLTEAERDLGVALIDIGGGTTDIAVFRTGAIWHSAALPVAGNHITRDLAQLLHITQEEAEGIKRKFGLASPDLASSEELIQVTEMGTGEPVRVPRRLIGEVIQPRLEEIFTLVGRDLERSEAFDRMTGGIVLSGGGSQLPGADKLASAMLGGLPVRWGRPQNLGKLADSVANPIYATGVGLALQAASDGAYAGEVPASRHLSWLPTIARWWSEEVGPRVARYLPARRFPFIRPPVQ